MFLFAGSYNSCFSNKTLAARTSIFAQNRFTITKIVTNIFGIARNWGQESIPWVRPQSQWCPRVCTLHSGEHTPGTCHSKRKISLLWGPDLYAFGPPRSGSVSQRYGSGSGSFYHQAKIVWKTLIPTVLWLLYDFLSLKNDVNAPFKSNKQKNYEKKKFVLFCKDLGIN